MFSWLSPHPHRAHRPRVRTYRDLLRVAATVVMMLTGLVMPAAAMPLTDQFDSSPRSNSPDDAGTYEVVPEHPVSTIADPALPHGEAPEQARPSETGDASGPSRRPNIMVIMADDMRVDDVAWAPNMRRIFGKNGVTFANLFSPYPLCCPARASFLTGRYAHNHGVYWHERPYGYGAFDDSKTLATSLKTAGYRTGMIGKHLNRYGIDRSKVSGRRSHTYVPNGWDDWHASVDRAPGRKGGTYNYFQTLYNHNGRVKAYPGQYSSHTIGKVTRSLVNKYDRSTKPFFLYVNYVAPHHGRGRNETDDPRTVRDRKGRKVHIATPGVPEYARGRFNKTIRRPAGFPRAGGPTEKDVSDKPAYVRARPEPNKPIKKALTELTRQRAEAVWVMDKQIGATVRRLKKNNQWSNTVVIFTSDNGYALGEHRQLTGKLHAHEPILRVPMLMTGPGLRDGSTRYDPISTVDLTATVLDLAQATAPHTPDGASRVPTLYEGDQGWEVPVVTESTMGRGGNARGFLPRKQDPRTSIGLRTSQYTFVRYRNGDTELYDLTTDPTQDRSVHEDPAYRTARAQFEDLWDDYAFCAGAQCRVELPNSMSASTEVNAARTKSYWDRITRVYGY